jgi:hypothetical protein
MNLNIHHISSSALHAVNMFADVQDLLGLEYKPRKWLQKSRKCRANSEVHADVLIFQPS